MFFTACLIENSLEMLASQFMQKIRIDLHLNLAPFVGIHEIPVNIA
jgi:hypothetical protein